MLIHCGDAEAGYECDDADMDRIDAWFGAQDFDLILCTGGNHDFALENRVGNGVQPFQNATFLQDSGMTWQGVRFHGAPWVPDLEGFEFYADEAHLRLAWAAIPDDVDVLITHTPPLGGLDVSSHGLFLGCPHLADRVSVVKPALHCFGHVHAASGYSLANGVASVNASLVNRAGEIAHRPFVFDLDVGETGPIARYGGRYGEG